MTGAIFLVEIVCLHTRKKITTCYHVLLILYNQYIPHFTQNLKYCIYKLFSCIRIYEYYVNVLHSYQVTCY